MQWIQIALLTISNLEQCNGMRYASFGNALELH